MAIKKSDLYSSLWASCDQLRGGMDASQYKDYVLFMLFIKYVSDKYVNFDGFDAPVTIPAGASFDDMIALKGKSDIGDRINKEVIAKLVESNTQLASSDFPDFNDPNKLGEGDAMVDRLSNLIAIFQRPELNFARNRAEHDDILGDAYEYLMQHFAKESGKSKGQFYTPAEVSRIIAQIIGIAPANANASTSVYDPTCGSGSLLLKVAAQAGKKITLEGQELIVTTAGLARMNMILHDFPTAQIGIGNTLAAPKFLNGENLRTYDYVVANPPFSDKTWSTGLKSPDKHERFKWGEPPSKQGDYAYLLHIIRSMNGTGKAACILPHGVLFRGNAEAVIREQLVKSGILKAIIGLPANLFYGTGIPACILVLDKENAKARKGIFMLDASKGFIKDGNKNRLREQDVHRIVDAYHRRDDVAAYARMVSHDDIADAKNDYNLNLPRYIDGTQSEDVQDIIGHLRGGIPNRDISDAAKLGAYWKVLPSVQSELFEPLRAGYARLRLPLAEVKAAVFEHAEFTEFNDGAIETFARWRAEQTPILKAFDRDGHPKPLIEQSSESLLGAFKKVPLLDAYDIYQHLMDAWGETMQDDCYLIAAQGWVAQTQRVVVEVTSGKGKGQKRDKGWTCDLVPKLFIVARFFAREQDALTRLETEAASALAQLEELGEEWGGEDEILKDVATKADAQEARVSALHTLWSETDKAAYEAYLALGTQAERALEALFEAGDDVRVSALKNAKGNLTQKAMKDRAKSTTDWDERAALDLYAQAETRWKAAGKLVKARFARADAQLSARLGESPLPDELRELEAATRFLELLDRQTQLSGEIAAAKLALDKLAYEKYPQLTTEEVKTLVVDDKWMPALEATVQGELDRVSQTLTGRIRQLAQRYETPLPQIAEQVELLSSHVERHLAKMGATWN